MKCVVSNWIFRGKVIKTFGTKIKSILWLPLMSIYWKEFYFISIVKYYIMFDLFCTYLDRTAADFYQPENVTTMRYTHQWCESVSIQYIVRSIYI